ncbi:MAG TPA: adenylate/guanylate cyclase domain-containing protein [Gaiellaceae bacterium]|nr:adenylate/guanylate cyclase domain-containing protein [Gaiellaceae bacterium]
MDVPETRYARSGEVAIAYQVLGDGPLDLVFAPPISHLELEWETPASAAFYTRLASICRLILFNQRGVGMSDRISGVPPLETRMDDIRAVLDAVGSERAAVFGLGDSGPLCVLFAATYPERTAALVLFNSSPRFVRNPELPWLPTRAEQESQADQFERHWGETEFMNKMLRMWNPEITEAELPSALRELRLSVSPGSAAGYIRMNMDVDVCDVLPLIRVPTIVMHRKEERAWDVRSGRYLAERIAGARFVELPGTDFMPQRGDQEQVFAELERFLADVVGGKAVEIEPDRVLATVLFTDIVGSSEKAASLGDKAWRELLEQHHELVRRQLARFRGVEVDTAGDGFFASFDGPARAIRCACAIVESVPELGLDVRAGLHTGECEVANGKVAGIAVHTGARVASLAQPKEVLVSSTVKDLVAGSEIGFEDRGSHELKGIPGEWRLYAVRGLPQET